MGVCPYLSKPNKTMFFTAYSQDKLTGVLNKAWEQLDWLNLNTNNGFKKLRQVKNTAFHKKASKLTRDRTEYGWMSQIIGVIADNPSKVRGYRSHRLFFEEFGSNPTSKTSWVQGKALVHRGGRKTGTMYGWGTGGDSGPALEGLSDIFTNPKSFNVLPCKHTFSASGDEVMTGFFIPAYRLHFSYLDDRGVTDEQKAKDYFNKEKELLRVDPKALMEYSSEYCFIPEDALIRQGDNQFNQELLAEQLANIIIHKTTPPVMKGFLKYTSPSDESKGLTWRESNKGDIMITEKPILDDDGLVLKNLYIAGIDSIDQGTSDSTGQKDVSDFCIVIKKRVHGLKEPQYVAMYKQRPSDIRFAYGNAMRLMEWYGCQGVLEATRTSIKEYLRHKNKLHLLMKRPKSTMTSSGGNNTTMFGAPANEQTIVHYLELIENFVNDYSHTINMEPIVDQLLKYSYEHKRKFDIIAAMGMAELGDEELLTKPIRSQNNFKKEWRDIGYFKDATGKWHHGAIPTADELSTYHLRNDY